MALSPPLTSGDRVGFGSGSTRQFQGNPTRAAPSRIRPLAMSGPATWRIKSEALAWDNWAETMTTAAAGLMVRPKWAPRAVTVPSRVGSRPIEEAAGTKNSITATAGAIPVPETTARHHGA